MAEGPIQSRRAFRDGNSRLLDFCLVQTQLGPMVEARPLLVPDAANIYRLDQSPVTYTSVDLLDTDSMQPLYGTGGQQVPTDWTP